jgi:hypothetical protein
MAKISKTVAATDSTIHDSITTSNNIDEYSVVLTAGLAYQFDLQGQGTGAGTLVGPTLALGDSRGFFVNGVRTTTPTLGDSRLTITPPATGTYLLDVGGTGTGAYTLVSAPQDDYSGFTNTTASLDIGSTKTGAIQTVADSDVFAVNLVAGFAYQFDVQGQGTGAGTLVGPTLTLSDTGGFFVNGVGTTTPTLGDSRVTYKASATATYLLTVDGSGTGSYTLTSAPQDDYNDFTNTTALLTVGGSTTGALQTVADSDTFAVNAVAGRTYQFDALGQGTGGGTLVSPSLALYNTAGSHLTSGVSTATPSLGDGRLTFTAGATATYVIEVSGTGTGTYNVQSVVFSSSGLVGGFNVNQQLELIYLAYFNRAADSTGYSFWGGQNTQAQNAGQSATAALTNIANSFAPQAETAAIYSFLAPLLSGGTINLNTPTAQAGSKRSSARYIRTCSSTRRTRPAQLIGPVRSRAAR